MLVYQSVGHPKLGTIVLIVLDFQGFVLFFTVVKSIRFNILFVEVMFYGFLP